MFCQGRLPDWRPALTPASGADAPAIFNVNLNDEIVSFEVRSGSAGYGHFLAAVRQAFVLSADDELEITFSVDEPSSGTCTQAYARRCW